MLDVTKPVITLKGDNPMELIQGTAYSEPGATATDDVDGKVTVTITGSVDKDTVGTYTLTYTAKDSAGNTAVSTRTVKVSPDTTPPTVTLNGETNLSLYVDQTYTERNATATDDNDGDVTSSIVITGEVNTSKAGVYTLTYTAKDRAGNEGNVTRTVTVIRIKKTGQTQSYNVDGNEITDHSLKDDGYYQKGITPRYTRDDAKEIVTDRLTGLMWQDDANVSAVTKQWLTNGNYSTCENNNSDPACYDTSGDTAATYCTNLTLGGYTDWRLPSIYELMDIVDRSRNTPALDTDHFKHVYSDDNHAHYWSSDTVLGRENSGWFVHADYGDDRQDNKNSSDYVRCVRNK